MLLAMPGSFGDGALNAPSADVMALGIPATRVPTVTVKASAPFSGSPGTQPEPRIDIALTEGTAPFGLTQSGPTASPFDSPALAWSGSAPLTAIAANLAERRYGRKVELEQDVSIGVALSATSEDTGLGFDVGVAPRFGSRADGDLSSRRFGGEVRLGQGIANLGDKGTPHGWYVFVGADGEALVWDADTTALAQDLDDVMMTDQVTVGDLQAGVSVQRGGGELSFSYIRREIKFDDRNRSMSDSEDFAGLTFTMRR